MVPLGKLTLYLVLFIVGTTSNAKAVFSKLAGDWVVVKAEYPEGRFSAPSDPLPTFTFATPTTTMKPKSGTLKIVANPTYSKNQVSLRITDVRALNSNPESEKIDEISLGAQGHMLLEVTGDRAKLLFTPNLAGTDPAPKTFSLKSNPKSVLFNLKRKTK